MIADTRSIRTIALVTVGKDLCGAPITDATLSEADEAALAAVLAALANWVRLRLIYIVAEQGEVCSCDLEQLLGKS